MALKEKSKEIEFFNIGDYDESSVIGEVATSSVKIVFKIEREKYAKKELKYFTH